MTIKSNLNILVVEDESYVAQHLQATIETFNEGKVYIAENPKEALDIISNEDVELVLMDILLPGNMDGIAVANEINKLKSVPVVYLTGYSDDKYLTRLSLSEPFGYLLKPVKPVELQAVLSIASQKHSNQLLLQRESDISSTLQKIFYPLVITDENLDITSMNDAAQKLFFSKKGNASRFKFYKNEKPLLLNDVLPIVAKNSSGIFKDEEGVTLRLENGSILPVSLTISIVYDVRKEIKAICIMFVDLTQQIVEKNELHNKQLEAAELLIKERILKDVLNIGKDINKALLFEDSLEKKLLASLNRIVQFANFNIAHILMHEEDNLVSFVTSNNGNLYISNKNVLPHEDIFSQRIYNALHKKEIDLWTESDGEFPSVLNERAKHLPIKSVLILPLHKAQESSHGVLIITSSHEYAFSIDIVNYFEEFANSMTLATSLYKHQVEIERLKSEKLNNYEQTVLSFIQVLEERDGYTKGHSQRVADYALMLAKELNLDEQTCANVYKAGILHDIGKIQTPDKILLKPSYLTANERELIEEHVNAGVRMLSHIEMYKDIAELIQLHHERYDGSGYPNKVHGLETPIAAAILQVADVFDAMTTTRIYRKSLSLQKALDEIKQASGTQFNPIVVEVALKLFKDISINHTEPFIYSEIDQERMAYYFQDGLTHLYNEEYLGYIGSHVNKEKFHFVATIRLSGISAFNDTYNWCEGNTKIRQIAKILKNIASKGDAMAFRVHGNRFLLISKQEYKRAFIEEQLKDIVDERGLLHIHVDTKNITDLIKDTNIDKIHEIFHKLIC